MPGQTGPLALVNGEHQEDLGKTFADLTGGDQPASISSQYLRAIHEARRWLDGQGPRRR